MYIDELENCSLEYMCKKNVQNNCHVGRQITSKQRLKFGHHLSESIKKYCLENYIFLVLLYFSFVFHTYSGGDIVSLSRQRINSYHMCINLLDSLEDKISCIEFRLVI